MSGEKRDAGKPQIGLIPIGQLSSLARVAEVGNQKYTNGGWKNIDDGARRFRAAALRHLFAIEAGEQFDKETQLPHAAHAAMSCIYSLWHEQHKDPWSLFVSGASLDRSRIMRCIDHARTVGFRITFDWTRYFDGMVDADLGPDQRREIVERCQDGVTRASTFLLIYTPGIASQGIWTELGMAKALGKRIVVAYPQSATLSPVPLQLEGTEIVRCYAPAQAINNLAASIHEATGMGEP